MDRRGFLVAIAAIPAALLVGIRPAIEWIHGKPVEYSIKPFLDYQRKEIAKLFGLPPHLIADRPTFGSAIEQRTESFIKHILRPHVERIKLYRTDPRRLTDEQKKTEEATDHPFSRIINLPPEERPIDE